MIKQREICFCETCGHNKLHCCPKKKLTHEDIVFLTTGK